MVRHKKKSNFRRQLKRRKKEILYTVMVCFLLLFGMLLTFYIGYLRGFYETTIAKQIESCLNVCKLLDKGWIGY